MFGREIFQSLLEVIKTNWLTSLNQVHSLPIRISSSMWFLPYPADNHKRFLTNLFGREIFQSFIEVITTNRFEASNQVHPLCVRIMSSMVFPCKADEQKHFSNFAVWGDRYFKASSRAFLQTILSLQTKYIPCWSRF